MGTRPDAQNSFQMLHEPPDRRSSFGVVFQRCVGMSWNSFQLVWDWFSSCSVLHGPVIESEISLRLPDKWAMHAFTKQPVAIRGYLYVVLLLDPVDEIIMFSLLVLCSPFPCPLTLSSPLISSPIILGLSPLGASLHVEFLWASSLTGFPRSLRSPCQQPGRVGT